MEHIRKKVISTVNRIMITKRKEMENQILRRKNDMEKLYFILSLILLSIITVVNIESGWRFIEVEFLTGLLIMAPDFIGGLCRDIAAIIEDKKKEP